MFETIAVRKSFAYTFAKGQGINLALLCAVIEHESNWDPWAIRYEPGFFAAYVLRKQELLNLSDTEARARAFSWGLMQILGETARELGFSGNMASLCDPATGVEWGTKKLVQCLNQHVGDVDTGLLRYNGGADATYPVDVKALISKYA